MTSFLKKAREWASPTLKTSAFLSRGVLTPEEFVKAGDELVFKCPTWSWGSGDPKYAKRHLPPDKQYLITRNVPCPMRVESMENAFVDETEVELCKEEGSKGEGWLVSNVASPASNIEKDLKSLEDDFDVLDVNGDVVDPDPVPETEPKSNEPDPPPVNESDDEDDEYADIDGYEEDNIIEDEGTTFHQNPESNSNQSNILQTRTYDISITYDKFYQTPRVWIFGYKEDGITPLTPDEMFQDVMSDYVKRTVTIETHPHIHGVHASIHPCQHGAVMKNIVHNMMHSSSSKEKDETEEHINAPTVEMYLFIFLKFVSSIIPTINYDFTMEVAADTRKSS